MQTQTETAPRTAKPLKRRTGGGRGKARGDGSDPIDIEIGRIIRVARTDAGMSQQELAAAIGVTFQQLQKNERGFNRVSVARLFHIARALGATPADLLAGIGAATVRDSVRHHVDGAAGETDPAAEDVRREFVELSRVYQAIRDPAVRRSIRRTVAALANSDPKSPIHDRPRRGRPPKQAGA